MDFLFTVLAFFGLIGIVITIHEGGHFFTALACNMKVLEFSLGFGPKVFQKEFGKDKIKFTLRLLPLGGFVKPLDESAVTPEEWSALSEYDKSRSFMNAARWKKALMVAGGPLSNFVLAFVIFLIVFNTMGNQGLPAIIGEIEQGKFIQTIGIKEGDEIIKIGNKNIDFSNDAHGELVNAAIGHKNTIIKIKRQDEELDVKADFSQIDLKKLDENFAGLIGMYFKGMSGDIEISSLADDMPAKLAGIEIGDRIIKINDQPTNDLNKTLRIIKDNKGTPLSIVVLKKSNQEQVLTKVTPKIIKERGEEIGRIGVEFKVENVKELKTKNYTMFESIMESSEKVVDSSVTTLISLKKIVTGEISTKAISGPLTIADYSGKSAKRGLSSYLAMMAAISIAVGIFNLVPIPLFDGGHLFQYLIEFIRRKDFSKKELEISQYIGFGAMGGIFTLAMFNDLSKYLSYIF